MKTNQRLRSFNDHGPWSYVPQLHHFSFVRWWLETLDASTSLVNSGHDPTSWGPRSSLISVIQFSIWPSWCIHASPHDAPNSRWIASVRWSHVLQGESLIASLKGLLMHVSWSMIAWTSSPSYRCDSFDVRVSNARDAATCPEKNDYHGNIVPHGVNERRERV